MLNTALAQWLTHDGKRVYLHGYAYTLKVSTHEAIYPYAHTALVVHAESVNKQSTYYRAVKADLGDDWSMDVLGSNPETYAEIQRQIGWTLEA
jgi:hypothetical protein